MPHIPDVAFFTLLPERVCEVLSPSNARVDRVQKMPIYARERIQGVWIVDPKLKTLEAYRLEGPRWLLLGIWHGDTPVRVPPFDALELDLIELWLEAPAEPGTAP